MKQPSSLSEVLEQLEFVDDLTTRFVLAHLVRFYKLPFESARAIYDFYADEPEAKMEMIKEYVDKVELSGHPPAPPSKGEHPSGSADSPQGENNLEP